MWIYGWIALGSALGGVARYFCSGLVANSIGETFPWGTLVTNMSGSLLIGLLLTLTSAIFPPTGRYWSACGGKEPRAPR